MQKSPTDNKLNETGQFGFNADTFRKQDDPEEENTYEKSPTTSSKMIKLPETSKFGDSKKLEDDPSV